MNNLRSILNIEFFNTFSELLLIISKTKLINTINVSKIYYLKINKFISFIPQKMDYNFKEIESKWKKKWEKNKLFKTDINSKKKFYSLLQKSF